MKKIIAFLSVSLLFVFAFVGCTLDTGGMGELVVRTGEKDGVGVQPMGMGFQPLVVDDDYIDLTIEQISLSLDGREWVGILDEPLPLHITPGFMLDLPACQIPAGEYHGVKITLGKGIHMYYWSGSAELQHDYVGDYPPVIFHYGNGHSGDCVFPVTNEYFLFSTLNDLLGYPIVVEPNETSFLVISFWGTVASIEPSLCGFCRYTSFLP